MQEKQDIETLLAEGKVIQVKPRGYSMYPLFVPGRDEALIAPVPIERIRRGDVVLYRREGSILVLHRVWKRKGDQFYFVGDNQSEVEGPLKPEQIKGILVGIIRKGRHFTAKNPCYRLAAGIWLALRPARPVISCWAAAGKKWLSGKNGSKG